MNDSRAEIIPIPEWLQAIKFQGFPNDADERRMKYVILAARLNVKHQTGGPFGAAVFESQTGTLVSTGVNLVLKGGLSILHAEIVAITLAQRSLKVHDLSSVDGDYELFTSAQPCCMCFGAILWSGIRRVVISSRSSDVERIGFDEGPAIPNWEMELRKRNIAVKHDVSRISGNNVLKSYKACGGSIYNPRNGRTVYS